VRVEREWKKEGWRDEANERTSELLREREQERGEGRGGEMGALLEVRESAQYKGDCVEYTLHEKYALSWFRFI
jgi:hypothetical protein